MSETLTKRVEHVLDRWNALPRQQRHELSGAVTAASLGLGELAMLHRTLTADVDVLERRLDRAETIVRDEDEAAEGL